MVIFLNAIYHHCKTKISMIVVNIGKTAKDDKTGGSFAT